MTDHDGVEQVITMAWRAQVRIHRYDLKQPAPTGPGIDRDSNDLHAGVATLTSKGGCGVPTELTKVRDALAGAFSVDEVNQLGRDTGQAQRLHTVTLHRLFLAVVSALASTEVESLADLLRAFNHQQGVEVTYKAF